MENAILKTRERRLDLLKKKQNNINNTLHDGVGTVRIVVEIEKENMKEKVPQCKVGDLVDVHVTAVDGEIIL